MNAKFKSFYQKANQLFAGNNEGHWSHLSRCTNLLVIANISLFFLTELVTEQRYYFTFFSLLFLGIVYIGLLLPLGLMDRLWYYLIFMVSEFIAIYFLVVSAWYWVVTSRV